jgi:hypothetical protein
MTTHFYSKMPKHFVQKICKDRSYSISLTLIVIVLSFPIDLKNFQRIFSNENTEAGLLNKRSCQALALAVTKFTNIGYTIWVTLFAS